jgi:hypothetical protein
MKYHLVRSAQLMLLAIAAMPTLPLLADTELQTESAVNSNSEARRPANESELRFWLENMVWHHRFSAAEIQAATGLSETEIADARKRLEIVTNSKPKRPLGSPLLALPYPGGRHPRVGFRDGAVNPQRETKVSIFTPWDDTSYVVGDVPEAIWSNLGLTYLAHTHVPTIWTKQKVELERLEWLRRGDGTFYLERKLPNGIAFSTKVVPDRAAVWFEMALTNGTKETLRDLRVQNCVMLAYAKGFEQQTNDNKVFAATKTPGSPYVAVHNADRTRWIISAWDPVHRPWANPPCPCLHSDPKFPDCEPGKTRYIRGLVTFHEGADIEAKFKELDAIGWRDAIPPESAEARKRRQARVAERRAGLQIICHRGASEFAHENTLEAYRATIELGADGNEIDIRETKDGVLVCFHDDILDLLLAAYGDVSDYTWNELRRFRFRRPGQFGEHTSIPTLAEVFALHRDHAGLMHLDIKRPGLDRKIADLLERFDLWEQVILAPSEHGAAIVKDPRFKPLKYKTQLYSDHRDVDLREIEKAMTLDGSALIVDDPRGCVIAAGRRLGSISSSPASNVVTHLKEFEIGESDWPNILPIDSTFGRVPRRDQFGPDSDEDYLAAAHFTRRARVYEKWLRHPELKGILSAKGFEEAISDRYVHRDWRFHGIEETAELRLLVADAVPNAVDVARKCLWLDDPALDTALDPQFGNPRSWHDWRIKNIVFPLLESLPGEKTEKLCRDYLALSDEEARRIGLPQFDAAAKTLLSVSPNERTALELLKHRHAGVRNRTVKVCLQHADEAWAIAALKQAAPHALNYIPPDNSRKPADE